METVQAIFLVLAYVAAIGFLVSGLDDLIFDTQYLVYLWRNRKKPHLSLQELSLAQEQWVALFVPAWQEGGVVNKMADYAARVITYEKYNIFIGVYPNDPETIRCVDEICAANPRIHKVVVPHNGPTSKADCLNAIYRAMRLNEIPGVREYAVVALHDSEDVIHPLAVKIYSYFVPRIYDMAQLPVFALELPVWKYWVGNCYIDDFAELHTKDMFIRESIGGVVPSAGIGTAFSRQLLEKLAANNNGDPFKVGNLTEDYEIGIRAKRAGFRVGVASYPVYRVVRRPRRDGTLGPLKTITEVVAIRDPFPTHFAAAVRQRSRWILGISFQTWEQTGWAGSWAERYTLLRDRRAPLVHLINMIGYLTLAFIFFQWVFRYTPWAVNIYMPPLLATDSLLLKLAIVDTGLLGYRIAHKFISVATIYNFKQAIFSVPRLILSNAINFMATARAVKMYAANKMFGTPVVWLKTAHVFPGEASLEEYKRTIEDLLVSEGLVTREQILQALETEKNISAPFALLRLGLLDENQFTSVWAKHSGLAVKTIHPAEVPTALLRQFPEQQSLELGALPVAQKHGVMALALREPVAEERIEALRSRFGGQPLQPVLVRPSNLEFARNRVYPRLVLPPSRLEASSEQFRRAVKADEKTFLDALVSQYTTRRSLPEVLLDRALLSEADARRLWAEVLGCPGRDGKQFALDRGRYEKVSAAFWWLHRLLPAEGMSIVTGAPPHPQTVNWLTQQLKGEFKLMAELPGRLESDGQFSAVEMDSDQALVNRLVAKGFLKKENAPDIREFRALIADPLPKWLLLQKLVTEERMHQTFLEISNLPSAQGWKTEEVRRLMPVLPPGFAVENGCYVLEEKDGAILLGLSQMPSLKTLNDIYDRLAGYPLCFQALSLEDAGKLRGLMV